MGGSSFYNPNWEPNMDQGDPFDSSLTSIVSSPVAPSIALDGDNSMIRELIGRLGTICNSGDASFGGSGASSATTSCYTTPLNSPPKLGLSMMERNSRSHLEYLPSHLPLPADASFVERAARFSCFGGRNMMGANGSSAEMSLRQVERVEPGRFSRVLSSQDATAGSRNGNSSEIGDMGDSPEGSSISEQVPLPSVTNSARKRKFIPRGKAKESPAASSAKDKDTEDFSDNEQPGDKKGKDDNAKPPEPLKDYIHVRARRGQATDSHSLAERVRREKISQRMKVLQDLVPGCSKVTGKAVMLDEIINYVQSLQRQVEFLSMKLSTLNPRMDFKVEAFVSKEMSNPLESSFFPADSSTSVFPYGYHPHQAMHLHGALGSNMENQMNALNVAVHTSMDGFCEASSSGVSGLWEDELHSIVQMGIPSNQPPPKRLQGSMAAGQMKIEL